MFYLNALGILALYAVIVSLWSSLHLDFSNTKPSRDCPSTPAAESRFVKAYGTLLFRFSYLGLSTVCICLVKVVPGGRGIWLGPTASI